MCVCLCVYKDRHTRARAYLWESKINFRCQSLPRTSLRHSLVFAAAYLNLVDLSPDHERPVVLLFPLGVFVV